MVLVNIGLGYMKYVQCGGTIQGEALKLPTEKDQIDNECDGGQKLVVKSWRD